MSFSANLKDINEIMSRNVLYNIPKNQRKYVWTDNEWTELFEDLFLIKQDPTYSHFLGSIVLSKIKSKKHYLIIDGQQRIVTLSILFASIINQLYKISEDKLAKSYLDEYLLCNIDGEEQNKIVRDDACFYLSDILENLDKFISREKAEELFNNNYGKEDKYNEKLLNCFIFMNDTIERNLKKRDIKGQLINLENRLINSEVIEIIVEEAIDGYHVFETLNARGVPLEQHELIKNFLYSYMRSKTKQQKLDKKWAEIINNVTLDDTDYFSTFISHYCTHIFGKIKKDQEYRIIRQETDKREIENLLNSIYENSKYYSFILEPNKILKSKEYDKELYTSLQFFKRLNIRQVRPLLLSLFEKEHDEQISKDEFNKCVSFLENFYFIYSIVLKNTSNMIDAKIVKLSVDIHNNKLTDCYNIIKENLFVYIDNKADIIDGFKKIGYSNKNKKFKSSANKRTVEYIFRKIENYLDVNKEATSNIQSIEHILSDDENNDTRCLLGNLLPLALKTNGKIKNKDFVTKIEFYKTSRLLIVLNFVKCYSQKTIWTDEDILKRNSVIAKIAFDKIWKF